MKGVTKLLSYTNSIGYLNIVITNQSGIARNFFSWKDYENILNSVTLQVVSRPGDQIIDNNMSFNHTKVINVHASSSFIRKNIFHINEISGILDQSVLKYINSKGLYN